MCKVSAMKFFFFFWKKQYKTSICNHSTDYTQCCFSTVFQQKYYGGLTNTSSVSDVPQLPDRWHRFHLVTCHWLSGAHWCTFCDLAIGAPHVKIYVLKLPTVSVPRPSGSLLQISAWSNVFVAVLFFFLWDFRSFVQGAALSSVLLTLFAGTHQTGLQEKHHSAEFAPGRDADRTLRSTCTCLWELCLQISCGNKRQMPGTKKNPCTRNRRACIQTRRDTVVLSCTASHVQPSSFFGKASSEGQSNLRPGPFYACTLCQRWQFFLVAGEMEIRNQDSRGCTDFCVKNFLGQRFGFGTAVFCRK